ncbi:MAG: ADP-ribosylglycohydrolase family protein [Acidobacteriota bacterium]
MKLTLKALFTGALLFTSVMTSPAAEKFRRLPAKDYLSKMKAGWIGQIVGVSWGAPTEGKFKTIIPPEKVPPFTEDLVNQAFNQDDLYVEMTFLRTLEQYGFDASIRQAGIDFANSEYRLWVANAAGRSNLRKGIAPPDSSHPKFHNSAGAIDYQIEADYSGLIAPGLPEVPIALGEKFGRLMNYGDGVYAGQFMGCMYAEAFFEKNPVKLVEAGLKCIPAESMYAGMVRDVLKWRSENPKNWEKTWELVVAKYRNDKSYYVSRLDVKQEGAFALMGLLYGNGDPDQTIIIAMRGGSDSDCNPSSAAGVLFTSLGLSKLPDRFYKKLDESKIFSYTAYNFPGLTAVCDQLMRQALVRAGGRVEKRRGEEVFVIPVKQPAPSKFEDIKVPGPIAGSLFTEGEKAEIKVQDQPRPGAAKDE